ncbi:MAG: elongation factor G [Pseudomonadota bacterium]
MARCVVVLGASHVGKSTLVDRLAGLEGGAPPAPASATEMRIAAFSYLGERWYALDCPGSVEFLHEATAALSVADAAVICVSPDPTQAVLSAPYLQAVEAAGTPAILFVNRMDQAQGRLRDIVAALQDYARHPLILRQIPIRQDGQVVGAVDLVSERAWKYREGGPSALIEIPEAVSDREHEARDALLEHLSEYDDWLLEEIIEDRAPADGPLYSICSRVLQENRVIPALIGSASHGNGIVRLMKALRHEAPEVSVLRQRLSDETGAKDRLVAGCFHARHRRHVGKTVFLRAFEDGLKGASRLGGGVVGSLSDPTQERTVSIGALDPGEIAAAVKSDHLLSGRLCTEDTLVPAPAWSRATPPLVARIVTPAIDRDEVKLSAALTKLAEDDPGLLIGQDPETGAQRIETQGPLHMRATQEVLADVFGVKTEEHPVSSTYRETITRGADIHYRHRKQSGGAGQFADVKLTVSPNPRGAGFTFDETVKGGAVPRNYIPAVEHGARDATARGPLGFPVVDVGVTLTDGQHHSVDSSDMAFRIAGRMGVSDGLSKGVPVLLQPIYAVDFHVPSIFTGALVPIVSALKGHVLGYDQNPAAKGWDVFRALLPGGVLDDLVGTLRSATQGVGRFETRFDHYEEVYGREAEKISGARLEALAAH